MFTNELQSLPKCLFYLNAYNGLAMVTCGRFLLNVSNKEI